MPKTNLLPRQILPAIQAELQSPYVVIIFGSRRVGKTSLLRLLQNHLLANGHPAGNILYFDLENPIFREDFTHPNYDAIAQFLLSKATFPAKRLIVFLDEVQYLENASSLLKYLFDHYSNRIKFVVSGSSLLRLKSLFSDSMVGRKRVFRLHPLSFREFLTFKQKEESLRQVPSVFSLEAPEKLVDFLPLPSLKAFLLSELFDFLIFGGFPEPTLATQTDNRKAALFELYTSYVQKDISFLFGVESVDKFNKLAKLFAAQIGNLVNFSEISNTLGISRSTVDKYTFLQKSTFFVELISPFYSNVRKELTKMPKIYLEDVGMRNALLNLFRSDLTDQGNLAENFVFNQLQKLLPQREIHFWRTKSGQEVDFVILWENEPIPIEVKFTDMKKPVIPGGLRNFVKIYSPRQAFILTKNTAFKQKLNKTWLFWLPLYLFDDWR
ncbi:MAG: ATP-binding protein [Calditrichaeota bacterium]|nr:ATP-binding protein [Calditrichota bacterium]